MTGVRTELDRALPIPVLVAGRHVPGTADVELVVDERSEAAAAEVLQRLGFERRGDVWARFHSCDADVVTMTVLTRWPAGAPAPELERMSAEAVPVDGCTRLRWLSLPDELLVLAQRAARAPGAAPAAARERLHRVLVAEPSAWVTAAERAVVWRAEAAVRAGREAYDGARDPDERTLRDLAAEAGPPVLQRSGVVALSGLDGSGKSTQSHALGATLAKLGHDTSVEWTRLSFDASLDTIAAPVKALLRMRRRNAGAAPAAADADVAAVSEGDVESRNLRERFPAVNQVWTGVVATANGRTQRRTTTTQLRQGRVVVRDRYVLDSVVQLHSVYGTSHDVSRQARIIERLSPSPLAAFYLRVSPDEAYRRKPEEYTAADLARHAERYEREAKRLGVEVVEADRGRAEIAAHLASVVWRRLT